MKNTDEEDWKKLRRVISYLNATIHSVKIHLNTNELNSVQWWVEVSYGTYTDLKGKTGATISTGKGCITSAPKKQKVKTTSSTISEVVGVHEASPQVLWKRAFLNNQ